METRSRKFMQQPYEGVPTFVKQPPYLGCNIVKSEIIKVLHYKNVLDDHQTKIKEFCLLNTSMYVGNSLMHIIVSFKNQQDLLRFKTMTGNLNSKAQQAHVVPPMFNEEELYCDFTTFYESENLLLIKILQELNAIEPLDFKTRTEISAYFELAPLNNLKEIFSLVRASRFPEALALAQLDDDPSIFLKLGEFCEVNFRSNLQMAIDCYQLVSQDSPHFLVANDKIFLLLNQFITDGKSEEEKYALTALKFRCALQSQTMNQYVTDQLFNELCGGVGLNPTIREIKGEADTLLAVARQIKQLAAPKEKKAAKDPEKLPSLKLF